MASCAAFGRNIAHFDVYCPGQQAAPSEGAQTRARAVPIMVDIWFPFALAFAIVGLPFSCGPTLALAIAGLP